MRAEDIGTHIAHLETTCGELTSRVSSLETQLARSQEARSLIESQNASLAVSNAELVRLNASLKTLLDGAASLILEGAKKLNASPPLKYEDMSTEEKIAHNNKLDADRAEG